MLWRRRHIFSATELPLSPSDLISHQAVIYTRDGGGESWTFRKATAEVSVVLQGSAEGDRGGGPTRGGELRHGVGGDFGVEFLARAEVWKGRGDYGVTGALPPTNLSAVYPTGRLASTKARAFVSFVEGFMAA